MDDCTYSPQISPGSPLSPMSVTPPVTLATINHITLSYPYVSPTSILTLRNPQLNDKFVINKSLINRHSRGNDLIIFRDNQWPQNQTINYSFAGLSKELAESAIDFFKLTLGKYVKLVTYESLIYKGIIISPSNSITQEGRNCQYTLKLDFQGILQI